VFEQALVFKNFRLGDSLHKSFAAFLTQHHPLRAAPFSRIRKQGGISDVGTDAWADFRLPQVPWPKPSGTFYAIAIARPA